MIIDLTLKITPEIMKRSPSKEGGSLFGHLGTHFDVMNKEFSIEYTKRHGIVFDVSSIRNRDIGIIDIDEDKISNGMFVAFYTGFIEKHEYGSKEYFSNHPQLSFDLIELLLDKEVSVIGIDCCGIRRGSEHTPADQRCADKGTFVVENLCNLKSLLSSREDFTINTYPMNFTGMTGLPCRVTAEI